MQSIKFMFLLLVNSNWEVWGDLCFGVLTCGKKAGEVKVCVVGEEGFIHEDTIPVTGTVEEGMSFTRSLNSSSVKLFPLDPLPSYCHTPVILGGGTMKESARDCFVICR
jgi:hypothetical protein